MLGKRSVSALGTFALTLTLSFGGASVQAAACKGLEMDACQSNDSCSWIKPYETKNGVKVDGYCRSKPNKSTPAGGTAKSDDQK